MAASFALRQTTSSCASIPLPCGASEIVALSAPSIALANNRVPVGKLSDACSVEDGSESQTGCLRRAMAREFLTGSLMRVAADSSVLTAIAIRLDLIGKKEILRSGTLPGIRHRLLLHPPPCSRAYVLSRFQSKRPRTRK